MVNGYGAPFAGEPSLLSFDFLDFFKLLINCRTQHCIFSEGICNRALTNDPAVLAKNDHVISNGRS